MSTTLVTPDTPTARKRRRKTRTKAVSHLPAIITSELPAAEVDLTPGREHLVCPTCERWTPLTGVLGTPKLVPHHTESARNRTEKPTRCSGSNRRVDTDVDIEHWRTEWTVAAATAAARRATKVLPKPTVTPAPAPSQITPAPVSAEQVRRAFRRHQQQCLACKGEATDRDGQSLYCRDGERLAETYLRLLRQEPKRRAVRELFARERRRFDRQYAAAAPVKRTSEWATVLPKVKAADTLRSQLPAGDAPLEARSVPLTPPDRAGFDRRQAELGRRYARASA